MNCFKENIILSTKQYIRDVLKITDILLDPIKTNISVSHILIIYINPLL